MVLLLALIVGFILGLKVGITLGHRAERRVRRLGDIELLYPKGDGPRVER
jgi:hypothetical protein